MSPTDYKDNPDFSDFDMLNHEAYDDDNVPSQAMSDADDVEHEANTYDQYVSASLRVPIGDKIWAGRETDHKRELDGTLLGAANNNPMLDIRTYEIEFLDGRTTEYTVNVITQNMYAHYNEE
jgi:hypothetical protein